MTRIKTAIALLLVAALCLLSLHGVGSAADRRITRDNRGQVSRIALIIGNNAYSHVRSLNNAINDANDMAAALKKCGFEVIVSLDADRTTMREAVIKFSDRLRRDSEGVFFYAGHGLQVEGENYLIPVNADVRRGFDVEDQCLRASYVLRAMEDAGNRLNIVILDACRENPFRSVRSMSSGGLAKMDAPTGSLIAYATEPGGVAQDQAGRNGLFTKMLLRHILTPELPVELLLKRVRNEVITASRGLQIPWEASSLRGNFIFASTSTGSGPPQEPRPDPEPPRPDPAEINAARINELLVGAEADLSANRLTTPRGYNALEKYQAVLKLDADNATARRGLGRIVDRYLELAGQAQRSGRDYKARQYLDRAGRVVPGDARVAAALAGLDGGSASTSSGGGTASGSHGVNEPAFTNSIGMGFQLIPAGYFLMGENTKGGGDNRPRHKVQISRSFYLGRTEVTQAQWKRVMGDNPSRFKGDSKPVDSITWEQAAEFVRRLNARENTTKYRLPTEAEWEYSCRAGSKSRWHFGSNDKALARHGWIATNSGLKPHSVGGKKPNRWGLHDMYGNVWEWCADRYGQYYYKDSPQRDPKGPDKGKRRVCRGGSWSNHPSFARSANRGWHSQTYKTKYLGLRVAVTR